MKRANLREILGLSIVCCLAGTIAWGGVASQVETWPQFRGNQGTAIAGGQRVPVNLGKETLRWSADLPGPGSSSPVIWGDRLFVTAEILEEGRVELCCLDAKSGARRWSVALDTGAYRTHKFNNLASGTPCVTEELVVLGWYDAGSGHAKLSSFTHQGDAVWTKDLGAFDSQHGVSLNPVASGDRVFINYAHMGGGYTGAFSLEDGSMLWSSPNPNGAKTSYVAPIVRELDDSGAKEVIQVGELIGMIGFDFESGAVNWSLPGAFNHRTIASPIIINSLANSNDTLIAAGCKEGTFFAARVPKRENGEVVRPAKIEWAMESHTPYVPTPVSNGSTVFALHDGGTLTAMNAETGSIEWKGKLLGNFYASPVLVDGKLYCLSRNGEMWVVDAGEEFKVLRTSDMNPPADVTWTDATPAVAHNRLYVRMGSRLDCY